MKTYSFQTSQPLTKQQIDYINKCLLSLPSNQQNFEDIPEWTTEIFKSNSNKK